MSGTNVGKNAGRVCWALAGTLCGGKVQGTFAQKFANCTTYEFYALVSREGQGKLEDIGNVLEKLMPKPTSRVAASTTRLWTIRATGHWR